MSEIRRAIGLPCSVHPRTRTQIDSDSDERRAEDCGMIPQCSLLHRVVLRKLALLARRNASLLSVARSKKGQAGTWSCPVPESNGVRLHSSVTNSANKHKEQTCAVPTGFPSISGLLIQPPSGITEAVQDVKWFLYSYRTPTPF